MEIFSTLLVLAGAALFSVSGNVVPQTCSARYQAALREALDVMEECADAAAYDCCQIMNINISQLVNTVDVLYELKSGVYAIGQVCSDREYPFLVHNVHGEMKARCDMETEEGGWLVIQRRVSGGTENFNRPWADYENGFGDLNGEFWYGLKNIHCLTARDDMELRFDFKKCNETHATQLDDETEATQTYQLFKVAGESDDYSVTIGVGEGTFTNDFMADHNGQPFSTPDKDNDGSSYNCADRYNGGWWFGSCFHAFLNGASTKKVYNGTQWINYDDVEMKIRPKSCIRKKPKECQ